MNNNINAPLLDNTQAQEKAQAQEAMDKLQDEFNKIDENAPTAPVNQYPMNNVLYIPNFIKNPDKYDIALLGLEPAMPKPINIIKSSEILYNLAKPAFIAYAKTLKFGSGQYNLTSRGLNATRKAFSSGYSAARSAASTGYSASRSAASRGFDATRNFTSKISQRPQPQAQSGQPDSLSTSSAPQKKSGFFSRLMGRGGYTLKHRPRRHHSKRQKRNKTKRHRK